MKLEFWNYVKEIFTAAFSSAEEASAVIEILLCLGILFLPKLFGKPKGSIEHEKSLRKIFVWKFRTKTEWRIAVVVLFFFSFHFLILSPYEVYKKTKEENPQADKIIQWQPPKIIAGTKSFLFLIGGNIDSRMQIRGTPATLDIQQIKTNNGVLIPGEFGFPVATAKFFDDTIYLNVNIPTKTKPIEINEGKSGPLPDGWDWNCNSNTLEIVDEQNQAVFQEIYMSPNFVWIRGALQFGGTFFIAQDNSMPPSPHGYFNVADIGLQTIFAYPSSENRGVKILK